MRIANLRLLTLGSVGALIVVGLLWESVLAPLRPGGSLLVLKVLPLALLMPGLWMGRVRSVQVLSLLIQLYLTEGLVRASDRGLASQLAWLETLLATLAFVGALAWARQARIDANATKS
jgi:uncharacterized membrane protein